MALLYERVVQMLLKTVWPFSGGSSLRTYSSYVHKIARLFFCWLASQFRIQYVFILCVHKEIEIEIKHLEDSELVLVVPALESRQGQGIFLFAQMFRRVLGPTQALTQCLRGWGLSTR